MLRRQRGGVGAQPKIRGMSERGQATDAQHELQAGCEQREDQYVGREYEIVFVADRGQQRGDRDCGERGEKTAAAGRPHQRAMLGDRRRRRRHGRAAEEAVRLERENDRHHDEFGDQRELRESDNEAA